MIKHICVVGLGYIGLPTAAMFANNGYKVTGVDVNETVVERIKKVDLLQSDEPGLNDLVKKAINSRNLTVQTKPCKADAFFISVPTPLDSKEKKVDLNYVKAATESIVPYLERGNLVVMESTVPVGTTQNVVIPILKKSGLSIGDELYVAFSPERVLPTKIVEELVENDRVVGGINEKSSELVVGLLKSFVKGDIFVTNDKTAEMIKLMENVYRDVNIGLANEYAKIAEEFGIDVWDAIKIANKHPRIYIHQPGPGVGGHCIPLDCWFLTEKTPWAKLIRTARAVNDEMPEFIVEIAKTMTPNGSKVTVLGVAYKGNVNDARETPAVHLINSLKRDGYAVEAYDPFVKKFDFPLAKNLDDAVKGSSLLIMMCDHMVFHNIDPEAVGRLMKEKQVFDARNFLNHNTWKEAGFRVRILGKNI